MLAPGAREEQRAEQHAASRGWWRGATAAARPRVERRRVHRLMRPERRRLGRGGGRWGEPGGGRGARCARILCREEAGAAGEGVQGGETPTLRSEGPRRACSVSSHRWLRLWLSTACSDASRHFSPPLLDGLPGVGLAANDVRRRRGEPPRLPRRGDSHASRARSSFSLAGDGHHRIVGVDAPDAQGRTSPCSSASEGPAAALGGVPSAASRLISDTLGDTSDGADGLPRILLGSANLGERRMAADGLLSDRHGTSTESGGRPAAGEEP